MIGKLQHILRKYLGHGEEFQDDDGLEFQLATATLLVEVACADNRIIGVERQEVRRLFEKHYALSSELTLDIEASAEHKAQQRRPFIPLHA